MSDKTETCCAFRRKIVLAIIKVLPEEVCGVSDAELADLLDFTQQASSGKPILAVRFCPWCGAPRKPDSETRVSDLHVLSDDDEDDDEDD